MRKTMKKGLLPVLVFAGAILILASPVHSLADEKGDSVFVEKTEFAEEVAGIIQSDSQGDKAVVGLNLEAQLASKGAFPSGDSSVITADEETVNNINQVIYDAVDGMDESVDISSYQISLEEANAFTTNVLNDNPDLFYVDDICVSYAESTGQADEIFFNYDVSAVSEQEQRDEQQQPQETVLGKNDHGNLLSKRRIKTSSSRQSSAASSRVGLLCTPLFFISSSSNQVAFHVFQL